VHTGKGRLEFGFAQHTVFVTVDSRKNRIGTRPLSGQSWAASAPRRAGRWGRIGQADATQGGASNDDCQQQPTPWNDWYSHLVTPFLLFPDNWIACFSVRIIYATGLE
jgi:hypothetical protein